MKIRKNISISDVMIQRAYAVMKARGFDDFSEFLSALVREEHERRAHVLTEEGPQYSSNSSPGAKAAAEIAGAALAAAKQSPPPDRPTTYTIPRRSKRPPRPKPSAT